MRAATVKIGFALLSLVALLGIAISPTILSQNFSVELATVLPRPELRNARLYKATDGRYVYLSFDWGLASVDYFDREQKLLDAVFSGRAEAPAITISTTSTDPYTVNNSVVSHICM